MNDHNLTQCWERFLSNLNNIVPEAESEAWVENLTLINLCENQIIFGGLNQFFRQYVKERYITDIRSLLPQHFYPWLDLKSDFKIFFRTNDRSLVKRAPKTAAIKPVKNELGSINKNNSFQRFINGPNSDMAYAAARAVAEDITTPKYNPLFICGAVGLGKTHLMQAIGKQAMMKLPSKNVLYCSAESFTNNVIEGIRFKRTYEIRKKYRSVDLLLIDDIQFLENKFSTQEEFFHTLNELVLANKQVVITADRYPREIKNIEARLINRFSGGMVAKIEPPDLETRYAIIENEITAKGLKLAPSIVDHIASKVKSNVRDIKGVLTKLEAESSLLGLELSLESAKKIISDLLNIGKKINSLDLISQLVAADFKLKKQTLLTKRRDKQVLQARQMSMYIARELTDFSYPEIGNYFGKKHSSVIQACRKMQQLIAEKSEIRQLVHSLMLKIEAN